MTDEPKKKKRPRDVSQLAKSIVDEATSEEPESSEAIAGRKGGQKGGESRANNLTAEQRPEIARKAAKTRWSKTDEAR